MYSVLNVVAQALCAVRVSQLMGELLQGTAAAPHVNHLTL